MFSFHNISDQLSFIFSYYVFIPFQPCFPNLLCNVYHLDLLISSFHNISDQLSFISSYYVSIPSQPCFPHLLCNVYHLASSDLLITSARRLCNHLGLYVCMCVCVFVCEHDNSKNNKHLDVKFCTYICHCLRKN